MFHGEAAAPEKLDTKYARLRPAGMNTIGEVVILGWQNDGSDCIRYWDPAYLQIGDDCFISRESSVSKIEVTQLPANDEAERRGYQTRQRSNQSRPTIAPQSEAARYGSANSDQREQHADELRGARGAEHEPRACDDRTYGRGIANPEPASRLLHLSCPVKRWSAQRTTSSAAKARL
jgi:hypothetical protein